MRAPCASGSTTGHAAALRLPAGPAQKLTVIGDARRAGKGKEAIADAFRAALLPVAGAQANLAA